jgi:predicted esterase
MKNRQDARNAKRTHIRWILGALGVLAVHSCFAAAPAPKGKVLTEWRTGPRTPATRAASLSKDEEALAKIVARFLAADGLEARLAAVREIEAAPAYDRQKLGALLHGSGLHTRLEPGIQTVAVATGEGDRSVSFRIPKGYDPRKPWPLVLAFHPTGGNGEVMIRLLAHRLGDRIESFVVAAPTDYQPLNVDSQRSWKPEHRAVLRGIKQRVHVDSDRVYAVGFSQGGYATWSYAAFYGDELAGAAPVACTFDAAPEVPGLWELFMPNLASVPMLHVWGSKDELPVSGIDLKTLAGRANALNERVAKLTPELALDVLNYRVEGGGHAFEPPADLLTRLLGGGRLAHPAKVHHRFRYLVQGRASWLEALSWDGEQWGIGPQRVEGSIGQMIADRAGALDGEVVGQEIRVATRHVGSFVIWIGDGMVDWSKPIKIVANGREVFEGTIAPNLGVCLTQAARTLDFDRLRWAGILIAKDGRATLVRPEHRFPEIVSARPIANS